MQATTLYDHGHQWIMFGRDPDKSEKIIDTNQYMITSQGKAMLLDPGGIELFSPMLAAALKFVKIEDITDLFASHQDPDIISSLGMWDQVLPDARMHCSWLWEGFIRHFGMDEITYAPIPDEGGDMTLGGLHLQFIPAHYLHSSGNFNVFDPEAGILFSGDIGASLVEAGAPLFVESFAEHIGKMEFFHKRWMPSNNAKADWIQRVRRLEIKMILPQHGKIMKGDDVKRFLDWFEKLEVGSAINR